VQNRDRLGLETAQKLIFVQQNDPSTSNGKEVDVLVLWPARLVCLAQLQCNYNQVAYTNSGCWRLYLSIYKDF
jgi:hypothetical protein